MYDGLTSLAQTSASMIELPKKNSNTDVAKVKSIAADFLKFINSQEMKDFLDNEGSRQV